MKIEMLSFDMWWHSKLDILCSYFTRLFEKPMWYFVLDFGKGRMWDGHFSYYSFCWSPPVGEILQQFSGMAEQPPRIVNLVRISRRQGKMVKEVHRKFGIGTEAERTGGDKGFTAEGKMVDLRTQEQKLQDLGLRK